ncbi:hypothetical protein KCP77_12015 [Salmonella enterica subsp. enterica]|nr:hypothetical protein KCP77_12015 [Salmonella enterica subsp. enterica]
MAMAVAAVSLTNRTFEWLRGISSISVCVRPSLLLAVWGKDLGGGI